MRGLLLDNLALKIVALILAVTLVITKREEQVTLATVNVPVRVSHPLDRVLVTPVEEKVRVTLEGRSGALDDVQIPPLRVQLTGLEGRSFQFDRVLFKVPPGVTVRDVDPPRMLVRFEEKKSALVPVKPNLQGEPQSGFRVTQVVVDPPTVKVEGAASAVDQLREVRTERLTMVGRNQTTTLQVGLLRPAENVAYLNGNQTYAVTITIEEKTSTRVIADRPIEVRGEPAGTPGYEVSPPTADITLFGPVRALEGINADQLEVFVNVAGANPKRRVLKSRVVDAAAPSGLTVQEVRPGKVTLVQKELPPPPAPDAGVP